MFRLFEWLRSGSRPKTVAKARPRGFRPCLEMLEDRLTPSTFTVTDTSDNGSDVHSLRYAVNNLSSGSNTINFPLASGSVITLTGGQLSITKNVTINGPGASHLSVSGGGNSRVFDISGSVNVHISGLTITDGNEVVTTEGDGGGGILNGAAATLTLTSDVVSNNEALAEVTGLDVLGGGLLSYGSVTLTNTTVSGNESLGGAESNTFTGGRQGAASIMRTARWLCRAAPLLATPFTVPLRLAAILAGPPAPAS